jgi:hypothetical protein
MLEYFQRNKKITKIGVMVKDLRPSTMNYGLISLGNRLVKSSDYDVSVFCQDWRTPPEVPIFSVLQYRNIWGFDGTLVGTDIDSIRYMKNIPNVCKKILYIWDIYEHTKLTSVSEIRAIYNDPKVTLVSRSIEYARIIGENFNRNVEIAPYFDSREFENIIKGIGDGK